MFKSFVLSSTITRIFPLFQISKYFTFCVCDLALLHCINIDYLIFSDVNECSDANLNDCSSEGMCFNVFGTYICKCRSGYVDPFIHDERRSGRKCSGNNCQKFIQLINKLSFNILI